MEVFKMIHHVNVRVVNELENKILGSIMTIAKEGAVLDEITLSKNAIKELFNKASKKKVCFDWEQYPNCPHCRHSYMLNKKEIIFGMFIYGNRTEFGEKRQHMGHSFLNLVHILALPSLW